MLDGLGIYETRMLVFMETEPQTNKYRQVLLNKDMFKKVSDTLASDVLSREGELEIINMLMSEEEYELPDLQSVDK